MIRLWYRSNRRVQPHVVWLWSPADLARLLYVRHLYQTGRLQS